MKRLLYIIIDLALIFLCIQISYLLLDRLSLLIDYDRNLDAFQILIPYIFFAYVVLMYAYGLYNMARKEISDVVYSVFLLSISLMISTMGICFLIRDVALAFPRSVLFLSSGLYFFALTAWRTICWVIENKASGAKKVAILTRKKNGLNEAVTNKYKRFYTIVYEGKGTEDADEMESILKNADEIFVGSDLTPKTRNLAMFAGVKLRKNIYFVPEYYDISIIASSLHKTDDIPTFFISSMGHSPEERFIKRFFDIILASIAFIITLPFAVIIALIIKLDGGPVIYHQERVTRDNRVFRILKFRTMIPNAEKLSGPVLADENDPRITRIGRFLRSVRLDELPQLWNILRGEMSIVGPRPERPFFVEQFAAQIPEYRYRHRVKAGLTGMAQVEGKYNTSVENKLRYDLIYINNYSIWRDFLIIIQTVKILFMKESTEGVSK